MAIGKVWSHIAKSMLGLPDGKHCHWCAHCKHDDGCSFCDNPESKFHDGDCIRSWDGEQCAAECGVFKIDPWYEDDGNVEKYFGQEAAASWHRAAKG